MTNTPILKILNSYGLSSSSNNESSNNSLTPSIPGTSSNSSNNDEPSKIKPSSIVKKPNFFEIIIDFFKNLFK